MTIANTFASKLAVAFVAVAMVFSVAAPASAQSVEDLQAQINALLAQIAGLSGGSTTTSTGSTGSCGFVFTRSLSQGDTGVEVMNLQKFLNMDADTRVAVAGAGAPGSETQTFGPATAAAVSKFQVKYRADVLTPLGLINATGFWGQSSIAKANAKCAAMADTGSTDGDSSSSDNGSSSSNSGGALSGEASLDTAKISSADDDEIEEGQEDAPIAELEVEFTDGDASISRIDVRLVGSGDETDPWDTFESFSLWVDGDKISEENADDEDDYLDEDDGTFRFSGLDLVAREDEDMDIVLAASVQNGVDLGTDADAWAVSFESVRYFDADDVATTDDATEDLAGNTTAHDETEAFTVEEEGGEDELQVKSSSNDPDGVTLALEDDKKSDAYTVFIFDLDTDDSENDIELNNVIVTVEVSSSTYDALVDDAEITIDGTVIDDVTVTNGGTQTATLNFDVDGDVVINAGDEVEAELMLEFNSLAAGDEGTTVRARVTSANALAIDAEGADDLEASQLGGSATGEFHTLRLSGLTFTDFSSEVTVTTQDTADDSFGEFVMEIEITAVGDDEIFIPLTDAYFDTAASTTFGVVYHILDSSNTKVPGTPVDALTADFSLMSGGDENNDIVRLDSGETATFELAITFNPDSSAEQYKAVLEGVGFSLTEVSTATSFETATPASDYDTTSKFISS